MRNIVVNPDRNPLIYSQAAQKITHYSCKILALVGIVTASGESVEFLPWSLRRTVLAWLGAVFLLTACVAPPQPTTSAPPLPVASDRRVLIPTATAADAAAETVADTVAETDSETSQSALSPQQQQLLAGLPTYGTAPELQNEIWFNSDPLQLSDLRGKVVMVEFWTYG